MIISRTCFPADALPPAHIAVEPGGDPQKDHGYHIGEDNREDISVHTPFHHHQEQHIEEHSGEGIEDTIEGKEPHQTHGPDKLGRYALQSRSQHIDVDQGGVIGDHVDLFHHRPEDQEDAEARQRYPDAGGKDVPALVGVIHTEADHTIIDGDNHQRQQHIGYIHDHIHGAVFRCGEHRGIKGHQKKYQQL